MGMIYIAVPKETDWVNIAIESADKVDVENYYVHFIESSLYDKIGVGILVSDQDGNLVISRYTKCQASEYTFELDFKSDEMQQVFFKATITPEKYMIKAEY